MPARKTVPRKGTKSAVKVLSIIMAVVLAMSLSPLAFAEESLPADTEFQGQVNDTLSTPTEQPEDNAAEDADLLMSGMDPQALQDVSAQSSTMAAGDAVYVKSDGSDTTGDGTYANPYQTIATAYAQVNDGGTIYLMDDIDLTETMRITSQKSCTITTTNVNTDGSAYTGDRVTISKATNFPYNNCMFLASYTYNWTIFKDLIIDGKGYPVPSNAGFLYNIYDSRAVLDNVLVMNFDIGSASSNNGYGVVITMESTTATELRNGTIFTNNTVRGNSSANNPNAIFISSGGDAHTLLADESVEVYGNTMKGCTGVFNLGSSTGSKTYIRGGKVYDNTLETGYALFNRSGNSTCQYYVSGNAYIYDNTNSAGEQRNAFLMNGGSRYNTDPYLISVAGKLGPDAKIGICAETMPSETDPAYAVIDVAKSYGESDVFTWGTDAEPTPVYTLSYETGDWKHFVSDKPTTAFVRQGQTTDTAKYKNHSTHIVLAFGKQVTGDIDNGSLAPLGVSGGDYEGYITPMTGAGYPTSIERVVIGEKVLTTDEYTYDPATGKITIAGPEITDNIIITATCPLNVYGVAFNANGGIGTMNNQPFTYGEPQNLTANAFARTGYLFTCWNTSSDGTGTSYADGTSVRNLTAEPDGVVTLYAQWKFDIETYKQSVSYEVTKKAEEEIAKIDGNPYLTPEQKETLKQQVMNARDEAFVAIAAVTDPDDVDKIAEAQKGMNETIDKVDKIVAEELNKIEEADEQAAKKALANTGDRVNPMPFALALLASGAAITGLAIFRRKSAASGGRHAR